MRTRLRSLAFFAAAVSVGACAAILGIEDREPLLPVTDSATSQEAGSDVVDSGTPPTDSGPDVADAEPDATLYVCPDLTPVASCHACDGGGLVACPATKTCVAECRDNCATGEIACVSCTGYTDGGYFAVCSPDKTPAPSCPTSGCACSGTNAAACPLGNMVCDASTCVTCGDLATSEAVCRAGTGAMKCKPGSEPDPAKRYRCK